MLFAPISPTQTAVEEQHAKATNITKRVFLLQTTIPLHLLQVLLVQVQAPCLRQHQRRAVKQKRHRHQQQPVPPNYLRVPRPPLRLRLFTLQERHRLSQVMPRSPAQQRQKVLLLQQKKRLPAALQTLLSATKAGALILKPIVLLVEDIGVWWMAPVWLFMLFAPTSPIPIAVEGQLVKAINITRLASLLKRNPRDLCLVASDGKQINPWVAQAEARQFSTRLKDK